MDLHIASIIKTVIAIIFWPLVIGVFIVTWQLSQIQNFQNYASGVIAREGGLTTKAIEQIDTESLDHYRGVFRVVNSKGQTVTYTDDTPGDDGKTIKRGTYKGGLSSNDRKIQPYGTTIKYNVKAQPTAFQDIPGLDVIENVISFDNVWSTSSLNRNAGAIAQDDTSVIDDDDPTTNVLLPQNTPIQVNLKDDLNKLKLSTLLKPKGTINEVEVVDDNRDETIAQVVQSGSEWVIKPLKSGSTSVKLNITLENESHEIVKMTRTYVIVVI